MCVQNRGRVISLFPGPQFCTSEHVIASVPVHLVGVDVNVTSLCSNNLLPWTCNIKNIGQLKEQQSP